MLSKRMIYVFFTEEVKVEEIKEEENDNKFKSIKKKSEIRKKRKVINMRKKVRTKERTRKFLEEFEIINIR